MLLPLIFSYAEIHYHLKRLFPLYYKKLPEIIADIPIRCIFNRSNSLPVLIIVKDSHLFPVVLRKVKITLSTGTAKTSEEFDLNERIETEYYSRILRFPLKAGETDKAVIDVEFLVQYQGRNYRFLNDNYDLPYQPFRCYISDAPLPYPPGWYAGDPHYHSIYTDDQVEFGADIPATIEMAKAQGLNWFFVTDHSYDLDDSLKDFTRNDQDLPKWKRLQKEVKELPHSEIKVLAGEEISIGNCRKKNVHLLAVNNPEFIAGKGDGAEKWFCNKPETFIKEIADLHKKDNLFIAAHPWEKVPFLQRLTLRRDNWHEQDLAEGNIKFLQIINGSNRRTLRRNLDRWKGCLLRGRKYLIIGGNDAHGNFNIMRQIKIPFLKLFSNREQIFGRFHTIFSYCKNEPVAGIKNGIVIVSNGPFLDFQLHDSDITYRIGSTIPGGKYELTVTTATSEEFGQISSIKLFMGNLQTKQEELISLPSNVIELVLEGSGYIRMEMETASDGLVLTNPVWFEN